MRVVSWNVAARRRGLREQLARVVDCKPEILALQEISPGTYQGWRDGLLRAGYSVAANIELVRLPYPPPPYPPGVGRGGQISRSKFNLTASLHPMAPLEGLSFPDRDEARLAFPEKYLVVEVLYEGALMEIHNAHSPPGSTRGIIKPQAFRAMRRRLDRRKDVPQILCGDFNTPISETDEGVKTAASRHPEHEEEWDAAELGILDNDRLTDVYRKLRQVRQSPEPFAVSHRTRGRSCRYDHIYASMHFKVRDCEYVTPWLEEGLSDHAPVHTDLRLIRSES